MKKPDNTFSCLLASATAAFIEKNIETAAIDARLLLGAVSGLSHASLISNADEIAPQEIRDQFHAYVQRRILGEPVNRILGKREFFGRNFELSPETLVPRDDTEILVETVLEAYGMSVDRKHFLEIGTGSGIISVTLACELPDLSLTATDISSDALKTASHNANTHGVGGRINFMEHDLFDGLEGQFDAIISNPPYIPEGDIKTLSDEVKNHDPIAALDGGQDGLRFYREIFRQAHGHVRPGGNVFVEIGIGQDADVVMLAESNGFENIRVKNDYSRIPRVVSARVQNS